MEDNLRDNDARDMADVPAPDGKAPESGAEDMPADIEKAEGSLTFLGDPNENRAQDKPKKTGFRRFVPLIVLCAVAVVLVGAALTLSHFAPNDTDETPEQQDSGIPLLDISGSSADRFEIKNSNDSFAFVKRLTKTFAIEGHESLPVDNSHILSALSAFGSLSAKTKVADNVTDFEQYGLNSPLSTVTWICGGQKHVMELGTLTPSEDYYMRLDGGSTVYSYGADNAAYFLSPRMDYYKTALFDFDDENDGPFINKLVIGKRDDDDIVIELQDLTDETQDSAYIIKEPIEHALSASKAVGFTDLMNALTSCTVYDDDVSPASLAKYGLDNPVYTFSFTNVQVVNTARFGNLSDNGYYYMYADGHDFIYIVDKDAINILTHDIAYYCESMSYTRSYDTIDSLTITGGGKRYDIVITGTTEDEDIKAYINNKYVSYSNFSDLYAHIIGISIKDVGTKQPGDELIVQITVNCKDGTQDVLRYYRQSELDTFFELNGKGRLILPTSSVEKILEFSQKLYDGQEIVLDW